MGQGMVEGYCRRQGMVEGYWARGSEAKRGLFSVSGGYMKHRKMHVFVLIMRWCLCVRRVTNLCSLQ